MLEIQEYCSSLAQDGCNGVESAREWYTMITAHVASAHGGIRVKCCRRLKKRQRYSIAIPPRSDREEEDTAAHSLKGDESTKASLLLHLTKKLRERQLLLSEKLFLRLQETCVPAVLSSAGTCVPASLSSAEPKDPTSLLSVEDKAVENPVQESVISCPQKRVQWNLERNEVFIIPCREDEEAEEDESESGSLSLSVPPPSSSVTAAVVRKSTRLRLKKKKDDDNEEEEETIVVTTLNPLPVPFLYMMSGELYGDVDGFGIQTMPSNDDDDEL